jgi:glycine cleavage system H protein
MTALLEFLEGAGIVVVGLLARLLIGALAILAVALPIMVVLIAWRGLVRLHARVLGPHEVGGLPWREGLYHAPGHTWIRRGRGGKVTVGIDGLVQRLVADVRRLELPSVGARLNPGEVAARIGCGEREAPIVSPLEGTVTRVNEDAVHDPTLLLRDPYGRGWLYTMEAAGDECARLPHGAPAREWFRQEGARLLHLLEGDLGLAAADGGELARPVPSAIAAAHWPALADAFLAEPHGPDGLKHLIH